MDSPQKKRKLEDALTTPAPPDDLEERIGKLQLELRQRSERDTTCAIPMCDYEHVTSEKLVPVCSNGHRMHWPCLDAMIRHASTNPQQGERVCPLCRDDYLERICSISSTNATALPSLVPLMFGIHSRQAGSFWFDDTTGGDSEDYHDSEDVVLPSSDLFDLAFVSGGGDDTWIPIEARVFDLSNDESFTNMIANNNGGGNFDVTPPVGFNYGTDMNSAGETFEAHTLAFLETVTPPPPPPTEPEQESASH